MNIFLAKLFDREETSKKLSSLKSCAVSFLFILLLVNKNLNTETIFAYLIIEFVFYFINYYILQTQTTNNNKINKNNQINNNDINSSKRYLEENVKTTETRTKKQYKNAIAGLIIVYIYCSTQATKIVGYENALITGFEMFIIISLIMMLIPFILKISKVLTIENGKRICKYNSIILLIISIYLVVFNYAEFALIGGLGALIYYYINVDLFVNEA
jgi:hypothetical protein